MKRRKRVDWISLLFTWVILVGAYLLFVSTLQRTEIVAGLAVAAFAALASALLESLGLVRFRPRLRDLWQARRVPWDMIHGTITVARAVGRQWMTGRPPDAGLFSVQYQSRPVENAAGSPDENAAGAARRALLAFCETCTPNTVVLGFGKKDSRMLYHQIVPEPLGPMAEALGARGSAVREDGGDE